MKQRIANLYADYLREGDNFDPLFYVKLEDEPVSQVDEDEGDEQDDEDEENVEEPAHVPKVRHKTLIYFFSEPSYNVCILFRRYLQFRR